MQPAQWTVTFNKYEHYEHELFEIKVNRLLENNRAT